MPTQPRCRHPLMAVLSALSHRHYRISQSCQTSHRYHQRRRVRLLPLRQSKLRVRKTKSNRSTSSPLLINNHLLTRLNATISTSGQRLQSRLISRLTDMHQNASRLPSRADLTLMPCIQKNIIFSVITYLMHRSQHTLTSGMGSYVYGRSVLGLA